MAKSGRSRMTAPEGVIDLSSDDDADVPDPNTAPAVVPSRGSPPSKRARLQPAASGTNAKAPAAPSADWLIQEVGVRELFKRWLPAKAWSCFLHRCTPAMSTHNSGPWHSCSSLHSRRCVMFAVMAKPTSSAECSRPLRDRKSHSVSNSGPVMAQDDEDEDDHEPEGYYPDDGGTASNIDAARTHVSKTRLEQGSQQQDAGALPADQMDATGDGPGEASSPELSDEQVCMLPQVLIEQHAANISQSNARTPSTSTQWSWTWRHYGMAHRRHTA